MNRWKMRSSFIHLLVSYLIILCIPFLIGTYIYMETVKMLEQDARSSNMAILRQSSELLERQLHEAEKSAVTLAIHPNVVEFMDKNRPHSSDDYFQIHEILLEMRKYDVNPLIEGYYLYFLNSRLLLSPTNVIKLPEDYGEMFRVEDLNYEDWRRTFQYDGRDERYFNTQTVTIQTQPKKVLTFQKMIFSGFAKDPSASVLVLFREEELKRLFHSFTQGEGWAAILDANGNPLFQTDDRSIAKDRLHEAVFSGSQSGYFYDRADGQRQFVSYIRSSTNGWTYAAALPAGIVLAKANYIQTITLAVTLVSLVIGIGYALWMARRNSKPVKKLIEGIKDFIHGDEPANAHKNDYEVIQDTVSKLVTNHLDMQRSMEEQLPYLQSSFFEQLLQSGFQTDEELEAHAALAQIALVGDHFFVIVIRFIVYEKNDSEQKLLSVQRNKWLIKRIAARIKPDLLFHDMRDELLALIVPLEANGSTARSSRRHEMIQSIRQTAGILQQKYDVQLTAGIGGIYENTNELWKSFREAEKALEYTNRSQLDLVSYDELSHDTSLYYFPHDVEMRIINSIKSGDSDSLGKLIEQLENENFVQRNVTDVMMMQWMYHLNGLMIRLFDELTDESRDVKESFLRLAHPHEMTFSSYFDWIKKLLLQLCENVSKSQQTKQNELLIRMQQQIEEHYSSSSFCLAALADHFRLSESYTSTFIKEQSGQTFSELLEAIRMKEACRLLRETDLAIAEIAEKTGYNSDKAFRRAFKRVHSLLPTAYRKMSSSASNVHEKTS